MMQPHRSFQGRTALVTGAASGLGTSIATVLGGRGAQVVLFDRDEPGLARVAGELTERGILTCVTPGDVTSPADCAAAVEVAESIGGIDVLVNSAGIGGRTARFWELTVEEWDEVFAVNMTGTFTMTRAVVPAMRGRRQGRIVNIASIAGKEGNPSSSHYSAAKAAVMGFTKSIGKELASDGILVNAVAPTVIDTPGLRAQPAEQVDALLAKVPMGRLGTADEVSRLVAFLVSAELTFSTGAVFDISGGRATY